MAFVNEYVSQEEIEKFDLYGLKKKYDPHSTFKKEHMSFYWVIDRDRKVWFKFVTSVKDPEYEHQYTHEKVFILHINDTNIEVRVWKAKREGHAVNGPMLIVWDLISITPKSIENVSEEEIKNLVKEALEVYGEDGASWQVPNTTVECRF